MILYGVTCFKYCNTKEKMMKKYVVLLLCLVVVVSIIGCDQKNNSENTLTVEDVVPTENDVVLEVDDTDSVVVNESVKDDLDLLLSKEEMIGTWVGDEFKLQITDDFSYGAMNDDVADVLYITEGYFTMRSETASYKLMKTLDKIQKNLYTH